MLSYECPPHPLAIELRNYEVFEATYMKQFMLVATYPEDVNGVLFKKF